jgi:Nitrate reductase delta subunit
MRSWRHCCHARPRQIFSINSPRFVAIRLPSEPATGRSPKPPAAPRIWPGRGEIVPYGSYYLTGFLHERPLVRLRQDLVKLGIERVPGRAEPEDHAVVLCEIS